MGGGIRVFGCVLAVRVVAEGCGEMGYIEGFLLLSIFSLFVDWLYYF